MPHSAGSETCLVQHRGRHSICRARSGGRKDVSVRFSLSVVNGATGVRRDVLVDADPETEVAELLPPLLDATERADAPGLRPPGGRVGRRPAGREGAIAPRRAGAVRAPWSRSTSPTGTTPRCRAGSWRCGSCPGPVRAGSTGSGSVSTRSATARPGMSPARPVPADRCPRHPGDRRCRGRDRRAHPRRTPRRARPVRARPGARRGGRDRRRSPPGRGADPARAETSSAHRAARIARPSGRP